MSREERKLKRLKKKYSKLDEKLRDIEAKLDVIWDKIIELELKSKPKSSIDYFFESELLKGAFCFNPAITITMPKKDFEEGKIEFRKYSPLPKKKGDDNNE